MQGVCVCVRRPAPQGTVQPPAQPAHCVCTACGACCLPGTLNTAAGGSRWLWLHKVGARRLSTATAAGCGTCLLLLPGKPEVVLCCCCAVLLLLCALGQGVPAMALSLADHKAKHTQHYAAPCEVAVTLIEVLY